MPLSPGPTTEPARVLVESLTGVRTRDLARRRRAAVARGVSSTMSVYAERAGGGVIVDVEGTSFIDFASGIGVTTVGSSAPRVVAAIVDQASAFTHTCFAVTPYEQYVRVAELLNEASPGRHEKRSALFNTGAEAIENAVKMARAFTGRPAIVVLDNAYHGRTNLTLAMTARSTPYKDGFGPFASEVHRVPTSYPFRDGLTGEEAATRTVEAIEQQVGAARVAAVVVEPIQGEGGVIVPAEGFLPALARWCEANGSVYVADEVQTGIARTGAMFASEHEGVVPDLLVSAKGLAGGLPLSAVTGRAEVMDVADVGSLGGTYSGNPLACAAAIAVLETIEHDRLVGRARSLGQQLTARLGAFQRSEPRIGEVRGRGAMLGIEVVQPGSHEPAPELTRAVADHARRHGLVLLTGGCHDNVMRLLPPLSMPDHLLQAGLRILERAFAATP